MTDIDILAFYILGFVIVSAVGGYLADYYDIPNVVLVAVFWPLFFAAAVLALPAFAASQLKSYLSGRKK